MATFQVNFQSYTLRMAVDIDVVIPSSPGWTRPSAQIPTHRDFPEKFPCMYLLHGFAGDHSWFLTHTAVADFAQKYGIAVVMPSGYNSAWENEKYGLPISEFLTTELIEFCERMFPVSPKAEDRCIAGFSMGGYGALLNGLRKPELYNGIVSISGGLDAKNRLSGKTSLSPSKLHAIYGDPTVFDPGTQDIFVLIENTFKATGTLPRIFLCCGTDDLIAYPGHRKMTEFLETTGTKDLVTVYEAPGTHNGRWCDRAFAECIPWMLGK